MGFIPRKVHNYMLASYRPTIHSCFELGWFMKIISLPIQSGKVEFSMSFSNQTEVAFCFFFYCFPSCFQYLSCLSTSSSNDKLAFDVGLTTEAQGEACWWTIHPASKQRSEGEKVRVGDDFILVSVSSERYLVSTVLM